MADIGQVLATGGTTIVGVAVGSGLTYWLGALNRRHQETREDRTRWYDARFNAYVDLQKAVTHGLGFHMKPNPTREEVEGAVASLLFALGAVRLVGSREATTLAEALVGVTTLRMAREEKREEGKPEKDNDTEYDSKRMGDLLRRFVSAARKDLVTPSLHLRRVTQSAK
jgi:hypothetical protein